MAARTSDGGRCWCSSSRQLSALASPLSPTPLHPSALTTRTCAWPLSSPPLPSTSAFCPTLSPQVFGLGSNRWIGQQGLKGQVAAMIAAANSPGAAVRYRPPQVRHDMRAARPSRVLSYWPPAVSQLGAVVP